MVVGVENLKTATGDLLDIDKRELGFLHKKRPTLEYTRSHMTKSTSIQKKTSPLAHFFPQRAELLFSFANQNAKAPKAEVSIFKHSYDQTTRIQNTIAVRQK